MFYLQKTLKTVNGLFKWKTGFWTAGFEQTVMHYLLLVKATQKQLGLFPLKISRILEI